MKDKRKYLVGFFIIFVIGLLLLGVIIQWEKISVILSFVFYGIVLAYLLVPASRWIEKFVPRSWAVVILFLAIIIILLLCIFLFVPILIKQMTALAERLPSLTTQLKNVIGRLEVWLEQAGLPSSILVALNELVEGVEERLITNLKKV